MMLNFTKKLYCLRHYCVLLHYLELQKQCRLIAVVVKLLFFSDLFVNALKVSLLILLFAVVFNSLDHTDSVL